jgi:hypothetical protein
MGSGKKDLTPSQQALSDVKHVTEHAAVEKGIHGVAHAISKAGPAAAKLVGSTVGKVLPIVGGGIPAAISAVMGDGTRGSNEQAAMYKDPAMQKALQDRARQGRMKNMITTKMASTTVKNPAYSGQSTMGKALMASAKKRG